MPNATYFPLIVGVISFVASVTAAVLAGIFVRRNEQEKWLRQERLVAYSGFVGRAASLSLQASDWEAPFYELPKELRSEVDVARVDLLSRLYAVRLLASDSVAKEVQGIAERVVDLMHLPPGERTQAVRLGIGEALKAFVARAKVELGSS